MPEKKTFEFGDAAGLIHQALKLDYFLEFRGEVAIPALFVAGETPLTVVVGDNASGKSFFRRIVSGICAQAKDKTEVIPISMEARRKISYMPWLSLVYGDEETQATGVNSASTVTVGITTSKGRDSRHVIFWDEPDLGLSDSWAAGMGVKFAEFAKNPPAHLLASFIVTHNKSLVAQLLDVNPHYLHLGADPSEAPRNLQAWFEAPVKPKDIDTLSKQSHLRFKAIQKILEFKKP